eukprot:5882109-Amphidinium_carterae.1
MQSHALLSRKLTIAAKPRTLGAASRPPASAASAGGRDSPPSAAAGTSSKQCTYKIISCGYNQQQART